MLKKAINFIRKHFVQFTIYISALVLNIYITNTSNSSSPFVKILTEQRGYIVLINFIVIMLMVFLFVSYVIKEKQDELDSVKSRYSESVKTMSGLIEAKYGQFSDFVARERVEKDLEDIVNQIPLIIGFTLHDYSIKLKKKQYEICMSCDVAVAQEGYDINTIVKKYYHIDKKIMNMVNNLVAEYEFRNYERLEKLEEATIKLLEETDKNLNPVNERIQLIFLSEYTKLENPNEPVVMDKYDNSDKRTGILGALLKQDEYLYNYNKNKEGKKGRAYYSFNLEINGKKKIGTMILNIDNYSVDYLNREIATAYKVLKQRKYDII